MNASQIVRFGLSKSLATAYLALLQHGRLRPPELAAEINETRTNAYSLLDKLVELKLARKTKEGKKTIYAAENPVAFERYIQDQRDEAMERARLAKDALPELLNMYQLGSTQPGVRFYQGKKGIHQIYDEQIKAAQPITYIRTRAEIDLLGFTAVHYLRLRIAASHIPRHIISPDVPEVAVDWRQSDKRHSITRTWFDADEYTAPVEWSVFGNKVAAISFGKEAIGMVIDSPQIAESLRQIFAMLDKHLPDRPGYKDMPRHASYKDLESFVAVHNDKLPR